MSKNKILDGVLGLCVGDALGVPVEFMFRDDLEISPVTGMTGYGTHDQPPGTWSDDTSMTLCLLDSLQYGYNLDDIADRFVKWATEGLWTAHGEVFDIGIATSKSIGKLSKGVSPRESGLRGERDNGNGALMRILPLSFYLRETSSEELIQKVTEVSSITHAHRISVVSCIFYVKYTIELLNGKDKLKAYKDTITFIKPLIKDTKGLLLKFSRILSGDIHQLNEQQIESSGFVIHTLEASLWCFLNSNSYRETVLKAVNLGDDTDTTAAVAGGLAGIYYGIENIPKNWIACLARKTDIEELCENTNKLFD